MKTLLLLLSFLATNAFAQVDLVVVDKSDRRMYLLDGHKVVKYYDIGLGKNPRGHKQQEGDSRTPEGTYTLDYKKEDSSYYRSMHISYPNEQDIENAKRLGVSPGGLIMVHGQPNSQGFYRQSKIPGDWTLGCIALSNDEMDEFMDMVAVGTTIKIGW